MHFFEKHEIEGAVIDIALGGRNSRTGLSIETQLMYNVYGHITLKAPVLVRSPKLSNVESGQYLDG